MALFSYEELNKYRQIKVGLESAITLESRASKYLTESISDYDSFDIFLSHSYNDKEIIPALKAKLEEMGYSVYVDWITDKLLSRDEVNKKTAQVLQLRMKQSKCLIYATSDNSQKSRWMPWELGYFDGIKDKMVGILPIKKENNNFEDNFKGEEYLGLYFYIDKQNDTGGRLRLWVRNSINSYIHFDGWLKGDKPYDR